MATDSAFHSAVPVIATEDVAGSVDYFVGTLGFAPDFMWGDPPVYAGVKAGNAEIYLTHDPATSRAIRERGLAPDVFLWVTGIDGIYAQHRAQGADIVEVLSELHDHVVPRDHDDALRVEAGGAPLHEILP